MGIDQTCLKSLFEEANRKPFKGKVLTLGKQDLYFSYDILREIAREYNFSLSPFDGEKLARKEDFSSLKFISDKCLFISLGFDECSSMDVSDYEGADYIYDLNSNDLPENLAEAFDVIIDGGTIEHVFHIPNALNNIFKMLKKGGRIIHYSPSLGYIDHGFYMFSPTIFGDFYYENKFEIDLFKFVKHELSINKEWEKTDYCLGSLNYIEHKFSNDHLYIVQFIATKNEKSTGDKIPQQSSYVNALWKKETISNKNYEEFNSGTHIKRLQGIQRKKIQIKNFIKKNIILFGFFKITYKIARKIFCYFRSFRQKKKFE